MKLSLRPWKTIITSMIVLVFSTLLVITALAATSLKLEDADGQLQITEAGEYILTGKMDGSIYVDPGEGDVTLILDGVDINSGNEAGIIAVSGDSLTIRLPEGSVNRIQDTDANKKYNASIYSTVDTTFEGDGALYVNSTNKNGIRSENANITFDGGQYAIKSVINGLIADGNKQGTLTINNGHFSIQATNSIDPDSKAVINGGTDLKRRFPSNCGISEIYEGGSDIMKAIIVDLRNEYAAALKEDGSIVRIANMDYSLGQSVKLYRLEHADAKRIPAATPSRFTRRIRRIVAIAASTLFISGISAATAYALPYGTVSVDGDTAVEYTINCFDYVLNVKALNKEGEELLSEMDMNDLCHRKIDDAISETLEKFETGNMIDSAPASAPAISVKGVAGNKAHLEKLQQKLETVIQNERYEINAQENGNLTNPEQAAGQSQNPGLIPNTEQDQFTDQPPQNWQQPEDIQDHF